jgi:CheY-like chemotaxis protein
MVTPGQTLYNSIMDNHKKPFVLLIDDNDTDNLICRRMIEITGFSDQVLVISSGKRALVYLQENEHIEQNLPDIIFLDINMPLVDGFEFIEEFCRMNSLIRGKCRIVILSSSDNERDIARFDGIENVIKFVIKPLRPDDLKEITLQLQAEKL